MATAIQRTFNRVAADGRVGKKDVEDIVRQALDGKGITKAEAAQLKKIRDKHADRFTAKGAEAFDNFLSKMSRSWSRTKNVHLPNVEESEVKRLLDEDPRIGIYTGRSRGGEAVRSRTGGSEASPARTRGGEAVTRRTGGTEASPARTRGTEATVRRPVTPRGSGGEVATRRSVGGESSRGSWSSVSSRGSYSRSYGGE